MSVQDHRTMTNSLPDNIIAFPGAHRTRPHILPVELPRTRDGHGAARRPNARAAAAIAGAELNARLLMLLGICTTSLVVVLSAIHVWHG